MQAGEHSVSGEADGDFRALLGSPPANDVPRSLPALLAHHALATPFEPALFLHGLGDTRALTWSALQSEVVDCANELAGLGFVPGSILLVLGDLSWSWVRSVLAAHRLGGTVVSPSPRALARDLTSSLQHIRIRFVHAAEREQLRVRALRPVLATDCVFVHGLGSQSPCSTPRAKGATKSALDCSLIPAFLAFEQREGGESVRRVIHHCALVREAAKHLDAPGQELLLEAAPEGSMARFVSLARWLSFGTHRRVRGLYD